MNELYSNFKNRVLAESGEFEPVIKSNIFDKMELLPESFIDTLFTIPYTEKFSYNRTGDYMKLAEKCILTFLRSKITKDPALVCKVILGFIYRDIGKVFMFGKDCRYLPGIFDSMSVRERSLVVWSKISQIDNFIKDPDIVNYIITHDKIDDYSYKLEAKIVTSIVNLVCKLG